jgi:hypothetical protein
MAQDANLTLQASVTKTATFNGSWVELPGGTPMRGLYAHVFYSAATNASGSNTVTFSIDISPDNGTTTYSAEFSAADQAIALSTTAQAGEIVIPFHLNTPGVIKAINTGLAAVRLTCTISGAGSTPTVTYSGAIELGVN